jgi:acyl-CoA synthetase (AMP-forming)/AMP-acid ligase II/thioesterase domain-containing protein/acyl carrier protein
VELQNPKWLDGSTRPLDWNGPHDRPFGEFPREDLNRSIIANLERVVVLHEDRVAVSDAYSSITFGRLWSDVFALGERLTAQTEPGQLIAILLPACTQFPLVMLACLAAGRPFVALDRNYPSRWIVETLRTLRPALILTSGASLSLAMTCARAASVVDVTLLSLPAPRNWHPTELGPDQSACVLLTSGSTAKPKGIVNSQRALQQRAAQSINAAHINAEDRLLTLAPLASIVGVRDVLTALLAGASIHLLDPHSAGPRQILSVIDSQRVTILFAAPALLRSTVRRAGARSSPSLRLVRVGGDTTLWSDIDLLRDWLVPDAAVQSIYAATEAPMMQWFVDDSARGADPRVPIGYPLPGNGLAVIDESGCGTLPGEAGELIVRSPYVALGSWTGTVDSQVGPADRVFRSGDLVRVRPDGLLERLGRKDRQIKVRGVRVNPESVECMLRRHPLVEDAAVLARTNAAGESSLVAYVSARAGARIELLEELRESMLAAPPAMRPVRWYRIERVPRLPNFKLDVSALRVHDESNARAEQCPEAMARSAAELPSGDIEETVARIWREVLERPPSGADDDFFQAGGDSLKALTLINELELALGKELSVTLINESPTLGALCAALKQQPGRGYVALVLLKRGAGAPPVYFIHGLGGNVAELFPVARSMVYSGAVYGIQARGLRPHERPHLSVEAMAVEYLNEIKSRQPHGPYCLCGYSFGGLVAFEMARRLRQSGERVAFVGLFDTIPSTFGWPLRTWLDFAHMRLRRLGSGVIEAPLRTWPAATWNAAVHVVAGLRNHLQQPQPDGSRMRGFLRSAPTSILKVAVSALIATARYRPQFYAGELTLFTPTSRDPTLPPPQLIWRTHARTLSVVDAVGAHLTMLSTANAAAAASSLTRCLLSAR